MKNLPKNKNLLYNSLLIFLLLVGVGITFFTENPKNLKFTGFVVNSEGNECDGNWTLNETSLCINGTQNLTWISSDTTNCTSPIIETQSCECVENWTCDSWSSCLDGQQNRTCTDLNSCGTTNNKPNEIQSCETEETSSDNLSNEQSSTVNTNSLQENSSDILPTEEITNQDNSLSSDNQNNQRERTSSCTPDWKCGDWQDCINNSQIRVCINKNKCNNNENKPETKQECHINGTCYDRIKNQNEIGIDCGGECKPCTIFNLIGSTISETIGSGKEFISKSLSKNNFLLVVGLIIFVMVGEAIVLLKIKKKKEINLDDNSKVQDNNKDKKEGSSLKQNDEDEKNRENIPNNKINKKENTNKKLNKKRKNKFKKEKNEHK